LAGATANFPDHCFTFPDCEKLADNLEKQDGFKIFFWNCQSPLWQTTSSHLLIYLANFELFFLLFLKRIVDLLLNCFVHDLNVGWQGLAQVLLMTSYVLIQGRES